MAHDSKHDHGHDSEPEQNEIGGPVTFAVILFGLLVTVIAFWHKAEGPFRTARAVAFTLVRIECAKVKHAYAAVRDIPPGAEH